MTEDQISNCVVKTAIELHRNLGPGLLESAYEACLFHDLKLAGLNVKKQVPTPLIYEGIHLECGYRIDLLVENKVIVEVKSVEAINDLHIAQLLTYLKLRDCRLGLLMNFNVGLLKNGIKRVVNGFEDFLKD